MSSKINMNGSFILIFFTIICFLFFVSCKDEFTQKPVINLKKHPPYLYKDTLTHINEEILVGITASSVGKGNVIAEIQIEKNDSLLLDSVINKSYIFFECRLQINSYDSTLYYFAFYDNAYNLGNYYIITTQFIDTIPLYDTIFDTISIIKDTQIFDSIFIKEIDTLIDKIDTLIKIEI